MRSAYFQTYRHQLIQNPRRMTQTFSIASGSRTLRKPRRHCYVSLRAQSRPEGAPNADIDATLPSVNPDGQPTQKPAAEAAAPGTASTPVPDRDDDFAKAWRPPLGEPPLWWVEKFEERRKAEARRKAEDPSYMTTLERIKAKDKGGPSGGNPLLRFLAAVAQVVQLVVVLGLLLILPASLHDGGLELARPFTTFAAYLAFFGLGSIARVIRYGKLAPRKSDRQVSTWGGRLAFAAFVTTLPLLHWTTMYRFVALSLYTTSIPAGTTFYDVIGGVGMALAIALNVAASRELGASYDRVAAPQSLVTTGPYQLVQHPIYTSYMLLFFSYGMWLHSLTAAVLMLLVCALYYRARTALEARVLEEAFEKYYRDYASRTKKFIPFLL